MKSNTERDQVNQPQQIRIKSYMLQCYKMEVLQEVKELQNVQMFYLAPYVFILLQQIYAHEIIIATPSNPKTSPKMIFLLAAPPPQLHEVLWKYPLAITHVLRDHPRYPENGL